MKRHLLIDIGGVLARKQDYAPGYMNLKKRFGLDPEIEIKIRKKNAKRLNLSTMKYRDDIQEVNNEMTKRNPYYIRMTEKQYLDGLFKKSKFNKDLIRYIRSLKHVKAHIFTNNFESYMKNHTKRMHLRSWTKNIISSHEYGLMKPDPRFYRLALKIIDARPEDCILLDNEEKNIETAKKLGMHAILYKNNIQTKKEMKKLLEDD